MCNPSLRSLGARFHPGSLPGWRWGVEVSSVTGWSLFAALGLAQ